MEQLWAAAEDCAALPTNDTSAEAHPERATMSVTTYSAAMGAALNVIQDAIIALDNAGISIQDQRTQIQTALRRSRNAMKRQPVTVTEPRLVYASIFRANAPDFAALFDAILRRKMLSRVTLMDAIAPESIKIPAATP